MRWFLSGLGFIAAAVALRHREADVQIRSDQPMVAAVAARRPPHPFKIIVWTVTVIFLVVAAVYFAFRLRDVITLALIALLLAVGLQGPVVRLRGWGVPRPLGLLTVYLGVVVFLVIAGWLLLPPVFGDLRALAVQAPAYLAGAEAQLARFGVDVTLPDIDDLERRLLAEVTSDVGGYLGRALTILNFTVGLLGGAITTLLVLVLSIFIVMEGPTFRAHLLSLLPPDQERQWTEITRRIAVKIQGWMLGTALLGLIIGTVSTIALVLLGMPYPFLLGLIAGIGEFIPMIGPIVAAVPAVSIAAFYGWGMFAAVLVLYIVIQQVENYVLVPRIMGQTVDLPALIVLVAFLIGTELMGVLGGILAMPVAAALQVLWLDWVVPNIRAGRDEAILEAEAQHLAERAPAAR
jgi:predicted PurR-regulated permease PerM